jgi:hypothetical protein
MILEPYQYRKVGGSGAGNHCTYCPESPASTCLRSCSGRYEQLQQERAAEGIKVTDHMLDGA